MQEIMLIKCFKNGTTNLCVEGTLIIQCFLEAVCVCDCVDTSLVSRVTGGLTYPSAAGVGSKPPKPGSGIRAAGVTV